MIVNVCPSRVANVAPECVWQVLGTPERFGDWQPDVKVVGVRPPGEAVGGQRIELAARGLGREWRPRIDVNAIDPEHRWIDFTVHLPFGMVNHERVTLVELPGGRTQVGFN